VHRRSAWENGIYFNKLHRIICIHVPVISCLRKELLNTVYMNLSGNIAFMGVKMRKSLLGKLIIDICIKNQLHCLHYNI
jgi:hypothetical protein